MATGQVKVNLWSTPALIQRLAQRTGNLSPVFRDFHRYHAREIDSVFQKLGKGGGTHRNLVWKPFSAHSLGRRRPSGRKVTFSSQLLQDTGRLRQDAATGILVITPTSLIYGPSVSYAESQYQERNVYSVTEEDRKKLNDLLKKALEDSLR